jgi:carboxymethylenebutenolidase
MGTMIEISGVSAYRADPQGTPKGGLIVIHEIWGLVEHIKGVADRFAAEGYLAIAPDILGVIGLDGIVGAELHAAMQSPDESIRLAAQPRLRDATSPMRTPEFAAGAVASLKKVVDYLEAQPGVDGRIAVSGFCFGGTYSFALAAADPRVRAAAPWYGTAPGPDALPGIACPVLAIYGSEDANLMNGLPAVTEAMADAGVDFTPKVYEGAKHAFFNDTGANYDAAAAADAWPLVLEFLERSLA